MPLTVPRRRAILALATVLAALIALVVPLVVIAVAQGQPTVIILNPSDYATFGQEEEDPRPPRISDKHTGDDETEDPQEDTYRLVATAGNVPADGALEFEIAQGAINITIGVGERVANDTFEFNWDVSAAGLPDGQYTLRAILYDGTSPTSREVARHERPVLLLNGNPERSTQATAADLDYPLNGQPAGFYTNPKTGETNMLVDFEYSAGTTFVQIFYTLSDPGDEPVWKECALDQVNDDNDGPAGSGRLQCRLESQDQGGASVTGIAALANDTPPDPIFGAADPDPNFNDAGDAVRIFPYAQDPSTLTVDRATVRTDQNTNGTFPCSDAQIVTIVDQVGRVVGDVNIDAHATGPSDQLKYNFGGRPFFTGPPSGSNYQPPDKGPHGVEQSRACNASGPDQNQFARRQGDTNRNLAPDIKHIETAAAGSGNSGSWGINMWTDRGGETQITFWADEDDDDQFCSAEPAVAASIGWAQPAPVPVIEVAERTICPIPVPPPPGSGTSTSTATATTSPTGTSTSSPDPDPRGCTITGTDDDETLNGTEGDDVICGNGGDDAIFGNGGNDLLYGDEGDDEIRGGSGRDVIEGGADDDSLFGEDGDDVIEGNGGNDVVIGGAGHDTLRGQPGVDSMKGSNGRDVIQGGIHNDVLIGGKGNDTVKGSRGADILRGGKNRDVMRGGSHDDQLTGGRGHDSLNGGSDRDQCRGGPGRDRVTNCE